MTSTRTQQIRRLGDTAIYNQDIPKHLARVELLAREVTRLVKAAKLKYADPTDERLIKKAEKLAAEICRAFQRIEMALYYSNKTEYRPTYSISIRRLAEAAGRSESTIDRDLRRLNELPEITGGLRLQKWESGGRISETVVDPETGIDSAGEDITPSSYDWPSPGCLLLQELDARVREAKAAGRIKGSRDEAIESAILRELIAEQIGSEKMKELLRVQLKAREERQGRRASETEEARAGRIMESKLKKADAGKKNRLLREECAKSAAKLKAFELEGIDIAREPRRLLEQIADQQ